MSESTSKQPRYFSGDLRSHLKGKRILVRIYDIPEHPEYEAGIQGTITGFPSNLAEISVDARGHVRYPVVVSVLLDDDVSDRDYESQALTVSRDLLLILYDVQVLMELVEHGKTTMYEFTAAMSVTDIDPKASGTKLSDFRGISKEVNLELLD